MAQSPEADVEAYLLRAQQGDDDAREHLIRMYTPFILRVLSDAAGRYVKMGRDDESSIGLMAFNEAIDAYDQDGGASFFTFAEMVIRRRLIDFFRRENQHRKLEVPFSGMFVPGSEEDGEADPTASHVVLRAAFDDYQREQEARERKQEIERLRSELKRFELAFSDLVEASPSRRDARNRAKHVAQVIAGTPRLRSRVLRNQTLPLKDLKRDERVPVSRKTIERHRRYIIAMVLILSGDYPRLAAYVSGQEAD